MVVHDMSGGYKDDAELNGTDNFDFFKINDFDLIDIFVYFSHATLSLPPKSWIDISHKHNTKVYIKIFIYQSINIFYRH